MNDILFKVFISLLFQCSTIASVIVYIGFSVWVNACSGLKLKEIVKKIFWPGSHSPKTTQSLSKSGDIT